MKTGIVVAMERELLPLLEKIGNYHEDEVNNHRVFTFDNCPDLIAVLSGVGELPAAVASTMLILQYGVEHIINFGFVGSYTDDFSVGDLVNITEVIHCDTDLSIDGKPKGQLDGFDFTAFSADTTFFESATSKTRPLLSSDRFLDEGPEKDSVIDTFGNHVADMEGAGIAVACYKLGITFSMLKCVSNTPDQSFNDYYEFSFGGINDCADKIADILLNQR